jgi:hypothetical protein
MVGSWKKIWQKLSGERIRAESRQKKVDDLYALKPRNSGKFRHFQAGGGSPDP